MLESIRCVAKAVQAPQRGIAGMNLAMEPRHDYKQTEVGLIPKEWEVVSIASILVLPIQNGVFTQPSRKGEGCKLINVVDLYERFPIDTKKLERFEANKLEIARFGVKQGDIFFTRSSLTVDGIAQCNIYQSDSDEVVVFDCHIIRVRLYRVRAEPFFLARYCASAPARRQLVGNAKTTTMTTIDQSVVARLLVALPPPAEQNAIAEALSDVDSLLGALDRLIAKKRNLKQAAMQQLLTGQVRLADFGARPNGRRRTIFGEFPDDWEVMPLSRVSGFITKGSTPTTFGFDWARSGVLFLRSECVSEQGLDLSESMFIEFGAHKLLRRSEVRAGDILMTITGNVGRVVHLERDFPPSNINQHIARIRILNDEISSSFVFQFLSQPLVRKHYSQITTGQAYPQISLAQVRNTELPMPSRPEQDAIAEVLVEMDAELARLEQRREKTRALKQGMMQELLTGRTRLILAGAADA